ncbi:LytTR family DNA-binding domain-containing protein [Butyrivibrio sp. VCD2006]|uniref:LytTR family DNA-binding domain-containing protein n=1 Tax=Butyrivibrio sp. VCD2006 TaxID=1280664 RepID=UPI0004068CAB|nr:LytTR family DNA-binding domain-containing protein [Butyrivibrio sp. VCD2006]
MKAEIVKDRTDESVKVEIHCKEVTAEVSRLKSHIDNYRAGIAALDEGEICLVALDDIFFIESVDKKTFIYTKEKVLSTDKRLYELEALLDGRNFFRCSKSVILNLNKVVKLKPEITRNILATLENGEIVVISRRYGSELKSLLGIGG